MPSNVFVVLMGMGTVFFGLIAIIILVMITGKIVTKLQKPEAAKPAPAPVAAVPVAAAPVVNKAEIIAAVSAAIAEELGTDVSGIRVHSFKKI